MTKITSVQHLLKLLKKEDFEDAIDCFVAVAPMIRSSKSIFYDPEQEEFSVIHEIDDTEEIIPLNKYKGSSLDEYITEGTLYLY